MKKFLFLFNLLPFIAFSQNIGIGTTVPSAKLTVEGNELTPDGQGAAIKIQNTSSTNAWFLRAGGNGTNTPINGFSIADNTGYHFTMAQGGNIGLGILPTAARLHINGEMRLQGLNLFEFGAGVAGKEVNAGKIGYNAFGQNGLVFIGGGTTNLNRRMFFFAEGGTVMNGPLDFNGPLRVNGNSGTAGQVLTSNGTGTAEWSNNSFSNNVRFAASFTSIASASSSNTYTSIYNTSGANVLISTNAISINKTGLYHFEGYYTGVVSFSSAPSFFTFRFSLFADGIEFKYSDGENMTRVSSTTLQFSRTFNFSQDVYIVAPAVIFPEGIISTGAGGAGESRSGSGKITGYLISD